MVKGTADTKLSADGKAAVDQYRQYLEAQTAELVTATKAFTDAVDAATSSRRRQLYAPSRIAYERIEPVAETFGDLDPKIDAREGDVPKKDWGGYHYIEQKLWIDGTTDGLVATTPRSSNENVETLAEPGEGRRARSPAASPTARSSCSTRCRSRRSRVRRSATRAPTSSTSRPTCRAPGCVRRGEADPRRRRTRRSSPRSRPSSRRSTRRSRRTRAGDHATCRTPTSPRPTPRRCRR